MMESSHKIFLMRLFQPLLKQNKIQRSNNFCEYLISPRYLLCQGYQI